MRMPLSVSKPTEGPWPVWPSRPSRSNMGIQGQKSSEMWCSSSSLFLRAMMGISCRWLYSIGTWNTPHGQSDWQHDRHLKICEFALTMLLLAKCYCHLLEHVDRDKSVRYLCRQFPSVGGLAGGPGEGVSRATGHPVDFLALQRCHQSRPLDGICGPVSKLALIVVAPCVHFSWAKHNRKAFRDTAAQPVLAELLGLWYQLARWQRR